MFLSVNYRVKISVSASGAHTELFLKQNKSVKRGCHLLWVFEMGLIQVYHSEANSIYVRGVQQKTMEFGQELCHSIVMMLLSRNYVCTNSVSWWNFLHLMRKSETLFYWTCYRLPQSALHFRQFIRKFVFKTNWFWLLGVWVIFPQHYIIFLKYFLQAACAKFVVSCTNLLIIYRNILIRFL